MEWFEPRLPAPEGSGLGNQEGNESRRRNRRRWRRKPYREDLAGMRTHRYFLGGSRLRGELDAGRATAYRDRGPGGPKDPSQWLARLWQAIQADGVDYLWMVEDRWGELCDSREVASVWADELLELLRTAWSDPRPGNYVRGTCLCLASLVAAGRSRELLEVLALERFPFWHHRKFGVQALTAERRSDEAIAFAEASRGLNQPDIAIDAACEKILLDAGRADEAYERYALTANAASTGLATFRAIARKYLDRDPKKILLDLAASRGDPGLMTRLLVSTLR